MIRTSVEPHEVVVRTAQALWPNVDVHILYFNEDGQPTDPDTMLAGLDDAQQAIILDLGHMTTMDSEAGGVDYSLFQADDDTAIFVLVSGAVPVAILPVVLASGLANAVCMAEEPDPDLREYVDPSPQYTLLIEHFRAAWELLGRGWNENWDESEEASPFTVALDA